MNGAHTKTEAPSNDLRKERETVDSRAAPGRQANFWPQIISEPEVRPVGQESIRLLVFVQAEA